MGLINILKASSTCPCCGKKGIFGIQFKYGFTRYLEFMLGEPLQWSGTRNDVGKPGARRILVQGGGAKCPNCGEIDLEFDILVEGDVLVSVTPIGEERSYESPEGFIVLEP